MDHEKKVSFQLLTLITTPKLAEKAAEMFKKGALPLQYRFNAEGTASSEIMDMLGLGSIDKSVLISMIPKELSDVLMDKLRSELQLNMANSGIAFTIPLNGANNLILRIPAHRFGCRYLKKGLRFGVLFARIESIKGSSLPTEFGSLLRQDSY